MAVVPDAADGEDGRPVAAETPIRLPIIYLMQVAYIANVISMRLLTLPCCDG